MWGDRWCLEAMASTHKRKWDVHNDPQGHEQHDGLEGDSGTGALTDKVQVRRDCDRQQYAWEAQRVQGSALGIRFQRSVEQLHRHDCTSLANCGHQELEHKNHDTVLSDGACTNNIVRSPAARASHRNRLALYMLAVL